MIGWGWKETKYNKYSTIDWRGSDVCDHCEQEFKSKKLHREQTHSCPIYKLTFKQYPYCLLDHMRNNHEELYCKNCNKCFTTSTKYNKHNNQCIKFRKCEKYFKTVTELGNHNLKCMLSTEESESYESSNWYLWLITVKYIIFFICICICIFCNILSPNKLSDTLFSLSV